MDASYCLITAVQDSPALRRAQASCLSDGWDAFTHFDPTRRGEQAAREAAFDTWALFDPVQFIRYLDDDDLLLPHRQQVQEVFRADPTVDVVYLDYLTRVPGEADRTTGFTGVAAEAIMTVHPWVWVARKSALLKVRQAFGTVWEVGGDHRLGGRLFFRFIRLGLKLHYLPGVPSVLHHWGFDPAALSRSPEVYAAGLRLQEEIQAYFRPGCPWPSKAIM